MKLPKQLIPINTRYEYENDENGNLVRTDRLRQRRISGRGGATQQSSSSSASSSGST